MTQRLEAGRIPSRVAALRPTTATAETQVKWIRPRKGSRPTEPTLIIAGNETNCCRLNSRALRLMFGEEIHACQIDVGTLGRRLVLQVGAGGHWRMTVTHNGGAFGGRALKRELAAKGFGPGWYRVRLEAGRLIAERELTGAEARERVIGDLRQELAP